MFSTQPDSKAPFSAKIGALFTSATLFISIVTFLSALVLLWYGAHWTLILFRVLSGFTGIAVVLILQRIPSVREVLLNMKEDDRTIATHWGQDVDLIRLTWYLRAGYLISGITMIVCVCLVMPYELQELGVLAYDLAYHGIDDASRACLLDSYFYSSWSFVLASISLLVYFVIITVEFVATCHIILYRNNPVKQIFAAMCKECYKYGVRAAVIGAPMAVSVNIGMAASPFLFKTTTATNFINMYFPLSQGYGYPTSTYIVHIRDTLLLGLPNYNPRDLVGADLILSEEKQDKFVHDNIAEIRKRFGLAQLQSMGIDPPMVSNYGSGVVKVSK